MNIFTFLLMCLITLTHTVYSTENDLPYSRYMEDALDQVIDLGLGEIDREGFNTTGCTCIGYNCGCCLDFDIKQIGLDSNVCVNASYLPDQYGISLTFSVDGKVFINETISAKNPPPVCFGLPFLEKDASICIALYNLDISGKSFSGCVKLQFRFFHVKIEDIELGCFKTFDMNETRRLKQQKTIQQKTTGHVDGNDLRVKSVEMP